MPTSKKNYNLAIVDDHNLFRKGLIKLIKLADREDKYHILFEAESGEDLISKLDKNQLPDIILLDIGMPDMDGYETVSWMNKYYPIIPVLVITTFETDEAILRMLRLGVKGFLSKDIEVEDMHRALETICNKGLYYSDAVSGVMTNAMSNTEESTNSNDLNNNLTTHIRLSQTEREFLTLACTELTYQQIADRMHLSPKTIDGYRDNLFKKFAIKSRVSLAMYAVKHGLVKI